jgi:2-oxoglutarate ferredoxin oxidoreductase subunit delta
VDQRVLPTIDLNICTGCGLCVDQCPTHAVEMSDVRRPEIVRPEDCAYCGLCEEMCPVGAIALEYEIVVPANGLEAEIGSEDHLALGEENEATDRPDR